MGKMLDVLRQAETRRPSVEAVVTPRVEAERDEVVDEEEAVPFIEIGPRRQLEASPSVLAATPPLALPSPPPQPARVTLRPPPKQVRVSPDVIAFHDPAHTLSGQYRDLFLALGAAPLGDRPRALLLTPALPEADASIVLLNLAVTAARQGRRRVVVVDGNTRVPRLAHLLGLPEAPGLREVLAGAATLETSLQPTDQEGLLALAAGTVEATAGPRWIAETTRSLLRQLRQRFDLVLVDGPAWDGLPDVVSLGTACDAVYLVAPERAVNAPQVDELFRVLPEQGIRLAGCILAG